MSKEREEKRVEDIFDKYISPAKMQAAQKGMLYKADFELNLTCPCTCKICFSNSYRTGPMMPREKVLEAIDDIAELGFKQIMWEGGESLLHPNIFEFVEYTYEKGLRSGIVSGGIPITKKVAERLARAYEKRWMNEFIIHIDTIDPENFLKLHDNLQELPARIQGLKNLVGAGFPRERIMPCITLTRPAAERIEETINWYIDEIGCRFVEITIFKPMGTGELNKLLEPPISLIKKAQEYRAKKFGSPNWNRIGSTECSTIQCRTDFYLTMEGHVMPCSQIPDTFAVGNIYQDRLKDIFRKYRDTIALRDLKVKGKCAECENNDICYGCRSSAYWYLGDIEGPDPKCWRNPEAKEFYLS